MEKIFMNEDGSRMVVRAELYVKHFADSGICIKITDVSIYPKGKRKGVSVVDTNDSCYRILSMEEKEKYREQKYAEVLSDSQLKEIRQYYIDVIKNCKMVM